MVNITPGCHLVDDVIAMFYMPRLIKSASSSESHLKKTRSLKHSLEAPPLIRSDLHCYKAISIHNKRENLFCTNDLEIYPKFLNIT